MIRRSPSSGATSGAAVRALLSDRRGVAAVEFALLAPVMTTLVFGMVDFGTLLYQSMEVQVAAHAGADYAIKNGWNSTAVAAAVTGATSMTISASPVPAQVSACVVSGVLTTTTSTTCPAGSTQTTPGSYVQVNARATFTPLIPWSVFGLPTSLAAQAMVRTS
jgi:Flp pilus assembly protein TadG